MSKNDKEKRSAFSHFTEDGWWQQPEPDDEPEQQSTAADQEPELEPDEAETEVEAETEEAAAPEQEPKDETEAEAEQSTTSGQENVYLFPPNKKYLNPSIDLETLPLPLVRFPGLKLTLPEWERVCKGWSKLIAEVAPDPASMIAQKKHVPYFITGVLKATEFVHETRRQALKEARSTFGKQRSNAHIASLGPAFLFDYDGDVFALERQLRALGVAAVIFSTHSYGFKKERATEPSGGGRILVCADRNVTPEEYGPLWDGTNHILGGGFDEHGRSPAQCYGQHARRTNNAPYKRVIIEGDALSADALIELGRTLRPEYGSTKAQRPAQEHKRAIAEELERTKLMGAVRPPERIMSAAEGESAYAEWMSGAAAFKRAFPDDEEGAFLCFDTWSACSTREYPGSEVVRKKFDEVPADYEGPAIPVTLGMLHSRAKRRAEKIIRTIYPPSLPHVDKTALEAFKHLKIESLGAGIPRLKGDEPIPPGSVNTEDAMVALEYLLFCWSDQAIEGLQIPDRVLKETRRRTEERCKRVELDGRCLVNWQEKNSLAENVNELADAILASSIFYSYDKTNKVLVRIASPASDPTAAARIRELHEYKGPPGGPNDPAQSKGLHLIPMYANDTEALRTISSEYVAIKKSVNRGTKAKPDWQDEIISPAYKPSANIRQEPDAGVLKDLLKRVLVERAPEIKNIVTAPVMPNLPTSTRSEDLLREDAGYLITKSGYDPKTGLYLNPLSPIVDVPAEPTKAQVQVAADLLREPWQDFPFASPGEGLEPKVSLSVAIYGTMISANRRTLDIAPGIAVDTPAEGMSSGKTLSCKIFCVVATEEEPIPVVLSGSFDEQRKALVSYFVIGNGAVLIDDIPNGIRVDSAALNSAMTSRKFRDRLLGANKLIDANTQSQIALNGCALNLASGLASRFLKMRLDTGLERPEDRSITNFKHTDLIQWVIDNRQQIVSAVHTITLGFLQECRRRGEVPADVMARRKIPGTRFLGPSEVLRDVFCWAFPDLPDPFLGFVAATSSSSTRAEKMTALHALHRTMCEEAGAGSAPDWTKWVDRGEVFPNDPTPKEFKQFQKEFMLRWNRMEEDQRQQSFRTSSVDVACKATFKELQQMVKRKHGQRKLQSGRIRFSSREIAALLHCGQYCEAEELVAGAMHWGGRDGDQINSVKLGLWLKNQLGDSIIDGLVLRFETNKHKNTLEFWIEQNKDDAA